MSRRPRAALLVVGAAALLAPGAAAGQGTAGALPIAPPASDASQGRAAALDAAAAWRDSLEAHRAPQIPTPGDTETVILMLAGPPAAAADPADRAATARALTERQDEIVPVLESLGATVTFRYRVLVNAIGVRLPAGRLEALAALPEVRAVVPVGFLAPAQAEGGSSPATAEGATWRSGSTPIGAPPHRGAEGPAHIALIDAGIDASHPWLGGGIGPTFPVIGGADLIDGDADPSADASDPAGEAHGTQMASIVLRSAALRGLAPADVPRLLAYRVVAREPVGGRLRPLARTDRVLAALERAVDPDGDGDTADAAEVILLGLASAFEGPGADPLADALVAADRVGASVVAPAGNDGPTFTRPGSVGGPAAGPTVIAVGGTSAPLAPRTADLDARLGPASARLGPLPLMGPGPPPGGLPVAILRDEAGISQGGSPEDFLRADGTSAVRGALVVVARGGAPLAETASRAAAAGAAALAVWDEDGGGAFPAVPGHAGLALPVVGMGRAQGAALARLAGTAPGLLVSVRARAVAQAAPAVASFSSWGPTLDGRQKPDLVAPAVDRPAAWPGRAPDGGPRTAPLTGTSAAAAEVAAIALRVRVDRPELGPRAVRALLAQAARPLAGVGLERQGAGAAAMPAGGAVRVEPAIVSTTTRRGVTRARIVASDLTGGGGDYSVSWTGARGEKAVGALTLPPGGRRAVVLTLPRGRSGHLVLRGRDGTPVARVPAFARRPATTRADALGTPEVRAGRGLAEVRVRLGLLRRDDGRVASARLRSVRMTLLPAAGGAPLPVAGAKQHGPWPAGTYRFLVARRLASGLAVPAGTYRLRVSAVGSDGRRLARTSGRFTIG